MLGTFGMAFRLTPKLLFQSFCQYRSHKTTDVVSREVLYRF